VSPPYQSAGTRRMAERLEKIAREADPHKDGFLNDARARLMREELEHQTNSVNDVNGHMQWGVELLKAGRSREAAQEFQQIAQGLAQSKTKLSPDSLKHLLNYAGLAYLRVGEQANCLLNHSPEACLLPIRGGGVHTDQQGSREAIKIFLDLLKRFPDDLRARWLLNIAYMTVGEYPAKVPPTWLISPQVFKSDYDIKRFTNVAAGLKLDVEALSGGAIVDDFDGDGYLDLMSSSMGLRDQLRYFHNNGDGTFTDRTVEAGLLGEVGGLNLIQTDYNNDGHVDVFVLRGAWKGEAGCHPNSLLRNNGDGTFDDVTEDAGLLSFHPTQTAVWFDFNNDGWLDVFIGNETTETIKHACELYRNNGDGTFTECAASAGVAQVGFVKAVVAGDFNNDGLPDLYLSKRDESNVLYRNDGPKGGDKSPKAEWHFTDVSVSAGVTEPVYSFPAWFWDYDNDGWQDIFVAGYRINDVGDVAADYLGRPSNGTRARLYRNNRDGTFVDVSASTHINKVLHAMGSNFGDLDNDGWLDFYVGTGDPDFSTLIPNRMFRNAEGKFFQDVTTSGGFGHLQKGHAVCFADIDNDGDQDVYEDMGGAYSGDIYANVLYANPGHGNHWITLKLEGVRCNRVAIGARIKVVVETAAGERAIYKTVSSGGSFGANPLRQEIGLAKAKAVRFVEIFWPVTGKTEVIKDLQMDRFYKIREGEGKAAPWPLKSFTLPAGDDIFCAPPLHTQISTPRPVIN